MDWTSSIGILYAIMTVTFISLTYHQAIVCLFPIRVVSGAVSFIVIPGALVAKVVLPKDLRNLSSSMVMGLVLLILECQMLVSLVLLANLKLSLVISLCSASSVIVLSCIVFMKLQRKDVSLRDVLVIHNKHVLHAVLVGLFLRLILLYFTQGTLAPDASLYADYARAMAGTGFNSSVANDTAVFDLWNGVQFIAHQGFVYIFAVSYLLLPTTASGPMLLLVLIGTLLIYPTFSITEHYFGATAARWVAFVLAVHPLFVFHSSAGYGPEIASLMLLVYGVLILTKGTSNGLKTPLIAGILVGLVYVVWSPNFYIICVLLPLFFASARIMEYKEAALFQVNLLLTLLAALFSADILRFSLCWMAVFGVLWMIRAKGPSKRHEQHAPFFLGILSVMVFWQWPFQVLSAGAGGPSAGAEASLLLAILAPLTFEVTLRFVFFLIFHVSPVLFLLIPLALVRGRNRSVAGAFLLAGLFGAAGTLKVFGLFEKETLLPVYLYSDSRFFLFVVLTTVIALGAWFEGYTSAGIIEPAVEKTTSLWKKCHRRSLVLAIVILVGFAPSYLMIPSGLALIDIEERYGWRELPVIVDLIDSDEAVVLADRAREFSWFTGKKSVVLEFSEVSLPSANASRELISLMTRFGANYLLVDDYTMTHWRTLQFLLQEPLAVGSTLLLDYSQIEHMENVNGTGPVRSLTLVGETDPNADNQYARLFRFESVSYCKAWNDNILSQGWSASDDGVLSNSSGTAVLSIGAGYNSTYIWRSAGFDLGLNVSSGLVICYLEPITAAVTNIEIWNTDGSLTRYCDRLEDGIYFCIFGQITIGDIRIVITGLQGDSVIINSISLWIEI